MSKRKFRKQQKGKDCSIQGCKDSCVSNDMCPKHNMAKHRYGNPLGKPPIKKVCKNKKCRKRFSNKLERTDYCSPECYKATPEHKRMRRDAVRKWREGKKLWNELMERVNGKAG